MNKKDCLQMAVALIAIVGTIIGINSHFAKAADVELLSMRLEQKIVSDASMQTEARMWQLLDRNNNARDCNEIKNEKDKTECRSLEQKLKELEKRNNILIEKVPVMK